MKRGIIYTRVSTDDQAKYGFSLGHQKDMLEKYCQQNNIKIIKHYEEDYSAKDFDRPEFKKLRDFCKKEHKNIDILLFTRWDRFSRDNLRTYFIFQEFKKYKIEINAIEQFTDDDPSSKFMRGMHLMLGEMERELIKKRTIEGMRGGMKKGSWLGKPPKGYDRDKINNQTSLKINEDSEIVKNIFRECATGLYSAESVRKKYYSKLKISKQAFYNMLKSPAYIGKILLKDYKEEKARLVDALHKPIIDVATYNKVQKLFNKKSTIKIKKDNPNFILRGHLICNTCGNKLTGSFSTSRSKKKYPYYHCQKACERHRADLAHTEFVNFLTQFEIKPEIKDLLIEMIQAGFKESNETIVKSIKSNDENIKINQTRLQKILNKYVDGEITKLEYNNYKSEYELQIHSLENETISLRSMTANKLEQLSDTIELISNLSKFYKKINYKLQKKLIGSIFKGNLIFNEKKYRTQNGNKLISLILMEVNKLEKIKIKKAGKSTRLSCYAPPLGLEPRTL